MSSNSQLNKLSSWINRICVRCGRAYPQTVLNIEAHIHHGASLICEDQKSCGILASKQSNNEKQKERYKNKKSKL